jgi:uncharacterized protein (TIGR03437 family)
MGLFRLPAKFLLLTACLLVPGYLAAQAPQFTIQDLGSLPDLPACNGTALSQSGDVVGYCTSQLGQNLLLDNPTTHVFLYSKGVMTDLNVTFPPAAFPTAVNDSGIVAGGALKVNLGNATASAAPFVYQKGVAQSPSGQLATALPLALNNAGQMAATSIQANASSLNFFIDSEALLDPLGGGAVTQLPSPVAGGGAAAFGINSTGVVAGASSGMNVTNVTPTLWQNQVPQILPILSGYQQGVATSINDSGVAAGTAFTINFGVLVDPNATSHGVMFNNGKVTDLGVLPNDVSSQAASINNSGSVVGFSSNQPPNFALQLNAYLLAPASKYHAFIYSGGKMYDLTKQLVNGTGWQLSFATQINNAGQIVGTGLFQGPGVATVQRAFLLTPLAGPSIGNVVGAGFSTPGVTSISPNGVFTIFGSDLASAPQGLGQIVANQLPTNLGGTCVESGTTKWNLYYVSPGQINALAGELPASGTVPVSVVTNCGTANEVTSAAMNVPVAAVAPEFLYFLENSNGNNPVAAVDDTTNVYVGSPGLISGATFAPVHAADVITAYGVGWGATTSNDPIGTLASGAAKITSSYSLTLGGMLANVSYIGLSPGSAGLYQVNFTVPAGLAPGNQALVLTVDGVSTTSNAFITVAN